MEKEKLRNAITEGIDNSFISHTLKSIFICIVCGLFIYFLLMGWGYYQDYKFEKEYCNGDECLFISPSPSCFPLENLICTIIVGNETVEASWQYFKICGYAESNAMFEQIKPKIESELKEKQITWGIKYLECN